MHDIKFSLTHRNLAGLAWGDPSKPLILALHGWLDNAASFIPLAAELKDYYLVALDFAGHGLSDHRSADAHYHQMDFVHDLHELVIGQAWKPFILLGHSMGGIVASQYVSSFADYVSHYITIESFGPMTKSAQTSATQLRESIESRLKIQNREAQHPESFDRVVSARAKAGDLNLHNAEILVNRNLFEQDGQLRWRTDRRLRTISSLRVTDDQAKNFMTSITCPTLAIMGNKGYDMMRERLAERQDWVKHLQTAECEGGHHVHMDNPVQVAACIKQFLQQNGKKSC